MFILGGIFPTFLDKLVLLLWSRTKTFRFQYDQILGWIIHEL